ncbi:MAG: HPr family phosphocarrier protein [Anaerolineae bacterium]|jgi:phosphotransferase system HPr (HPr) family protein
MPAVTLTVSHEAGLHARPAALFVKTAKRFACDIRVSCDESEANAKSVLSVLTLGASQGAVVTVRAEGEDADEALQALKSLVDSNFEVGD